MIISCLHNAPPSCGDVQCDLDHHGRLASMMPGTATTGGSVTGTGDLDLRKIGQARNTLMGLKLNQVTRNSNNTGNVRLVDNIINSSN